MIPVLPPAPRPALGNHLFLLLCAEGQAVEAGSNRPFLLDDPRSVWLLAGGEVDISSVHLPFQGEAEGRQHFFSASAGEVLFGVGLGGAHGLTLQGVAAPGAALRKIPLSLWQERAADPAFTDLAALLLDQWLAALLRGVTARLRPRSYQELRPGQNTLAARSCASSPTRPLWIELQQGTAHLFGEPTLPLAAGPRLVPLADRAWLESATDLVVRAVDTPALLRSDPGAASLGPFHEMVLRCLALRRECGERQERERVAALLRMDRTVVGATLAGLAGVLRDRVPGPELPSEATAAAGEGREHPLLQACRAVLRALGVASCPRPPLDEQGQPKARDPLLAVARAARMRVRQVVLRGSWWRGDHGPLVGYRQEDQRPVALLPTSPRRYEAYDVVRGTRAPVTAAVAQTLSPFAHMFYRRLPDRPLQAADLLRFGLFQCRSDLLALLVLGLGVGLLGLVTPLCTGLLFDAVIPGAQRTQLLQLCLGMLLGMLTSSAFNLASGFATLRIEAKLGASLQAAVWDRLLDLPARFFRGFSAGDLTQRAATIQFLCRAIFGMTMGTLLSGIFGVANGLLLFYFDPKLALLGLLLVLLAVGCAALAGWRQVAVMRPMVTMNGHLDGLVFQLLSGVAKLRITGAERRAFANWARQFGEMRRLALKVRAPLQVFNSVYPLLCAMVLYGAVQGEGGLSSTGSFIAFVVAFEALLQSALAVCQVGISLPLLRMSYQRMVPILEAVPEVDGAKGDPGELSGEIEISHVSFRYGDHGPLILDDVSLHIRPGEFVAITGGSGSGKSTLLRLLLGFDRPAQGAVYYSGQDLQGLDVREVRRQIGVVLQDGKLMADDIFHNIVGSAKLTQEQAMEAARMAGFDKDIEQMPMGLHTLVSEGGSTLSGGQRQRLLIARALVRRPRILLFDEATSALDNQTQALVSASIEKLAATRVVIAHRLSTIVRADRIVVLQGGRLVQSGTYEELLRQPGPFAELAQRQLVTAPEKPAERRKVQR